MWIPPTRRAEDEGVAREDRRAAARASSRLRVFETEAFRSSISCALLPRRVILNLGDEVTVSGSKVASGVGGNGGFCIPGLGAIRSFWFSGGTSKSAAMAAESSWRVAVLGREKVCGAPWWWMVRVIESEDKSAAAAEADAAGGLSDMLWLVASAPGGESTSADAIVSKEWSRNSRGEKKKQREEEREMIRRQEVSLRVCRLPSPRLSAEALRT